MPYSFVLTGGGTGGHVFPALAVADVLRARGHRILYIGTKQGIEARLVAEAGYEMEFVEAGALNRVTVRQRLGTALLLPKSIWSASVLLRSFGSQAVFSMGGFVAGPVMAAAMINRVPLIVMEPNAIPGFANRRVAQRVYRALLGFDATRSWFPLAKSEVTGLPVRSAFFHVPPKTGGKFAVLVTGGSRGAKTLNRAARDSWPLFRESGAPVRIFLQSGPAEYETLARELETAGVDGAVVPFIRDMPSAFGEADLVIGRAGAGAVSEIAAAGMPSVLVPFPFAADDHQQKNAALLADAGSARMVLDRDMTGNRLFQEVEALRANPAELGRMRTEVRKFARMGAAERAAEVLEEAAQRRNL